MGLFCICRHLDMYKLIIVCVLSFCNRHQTLVTLGPWLHLEI